MPVAGLGLTKVTSSSFFRRAKTDTQLFVPCADHTPRPTLTRFDFHIIRRFLGGYLALLAGLILFFIVLHYVEYMDDFNEKGADIWDVFLTYYPNSIPEIIRLVSPLALFLSAVYLTGRLSQKLELSTLQTSGVSLYRLLLPYSLIAVFVVVFMFFFNGWIVPITNKVKLEFELAYTKDSRVLEYTNIHRQNQRGSLVSVGFFDRADSSGRTISLHRFDENKRLLQRIDADRMSWIDSTDTWLLVNPVVRKFGVDGSESYSFYAQIDTALALLPRDLARTETDMEAMTIKEGKGYLDELRRSGADQIGLPLVTYFNKFSYPLSNLILVLLGVPLASVRRRGGQTLLLATALFIAFTYLTVIKLTEPFGYTGELSPALAAWLPHIVFGIVAVILILRVRK